MLDRVEKARGRPVLELVLVLPPGQSRNVMLLFLVGSRAVTEGLMTCGGRWFQLFIAV